MTVIGANICVFLNYVEFLSDNLLGDNHECSNLLCILSTVCSKMGQSHCFASHKKVIAKNLGCEVQSRFPSQAQLLNFVFQVCSAKHNFPYWSWIVIGCWIELILVFRELNPILQTFSTFNIWVWGGYQYRSLLVKSLKSKWSHKSLV